MITLYDYYRSSASFRVRIALNLKKIPYEVKHIHLVEGDQQKDTYKELNPLGRVPTLVDGQTTLTQSLAIIDYLDKKYPKPLLMSENPTERAQMLSFTLTIAADIHPLNNLAATKYLMERLGVNETAKNTWYTHWIVNGFTALEKVLQNRAGTFCFGSSLSIADICLVPQVYNANRFAMNLSAFPIINRINKHCLTLPEFQKATPEAVVEIYKEKGWKI